MHAISSSGDRRIMIFTIVEATRISTTWKGQQDRSLAR
jgi:hypothetical protein